MKVEKKDLAYWEANAKEDYGSTPVSVLRYIAELETEQNQRVIEELEGLVELSEFNEFTLKHFVLTSDVVKRIKELKQEI